MVVTFNSLRYSNSCCNNRLIVILSALSLYSMVFMRFAWMVTKFAYLFFKEMEFTLFDLNDYRCSQETCFFLPAISQTQEHRLLRVCDSSSTQAKRKKKLQNKLQLQHSGQESLGHILFFVSFCTDYTQKG